MRGFYFDFEAEAPGPVVATTAEVIEALSDLTAVQRDYEGAYERFRARFCSLEDGHAVGPRGRCRVCAGQPRSSVVKFGLLLSAQSFEEFWGARSGSTKEQYVHEWRSGWVWSYCRMLRAEGVTPYVYVATLGEGALHETAEGYRVRFLPLEPGYRAWRRFPLLGRSPYGRFATGIVNGASLLQALLAGIEEDEIEVLGFQEYWQSRYDLLVPRVPVPSIAVDQGYVGDREVKIAKSRTFPQARRIVTQTAYEADRLRSYGARAERIPNAINHDFWSPNTGGVSDARTVICVARLNDDHKRISDLVRALGAARRAVAPGAGGQGGRRGGPPAARR